MDFSGEDEKGYPSGLIPGIWWQRNMDTDWGCVFRCLGSSGLAMPGLPGAHYGWNSVGQVVRTSIHTAFQVVFKLGYEGMYGVDSSYKPVRFDMCSDGGRSGGMNTAMIEGCKWRDQHGVYGDCVTQRIPEWLETLLSRPGQKLSTETDSLLGVVRGATGLLHCPDDELDFEEREPEDETEPDEEEEDARG